MTSFKFFLALIILSLLGLFDASYLTFKHYAGLPMSCSLLQGCEKVLTSQYAVIGGLPVALLGVGYYLAIFVVSASSFRYPSAKTLVLIRLLSPFGFLGSLWFVYLQLFVLKAICLYCLISAVTSTLIFIFSFIALKEGSFRKGRG